MERRACSYNSCFANNNFSLEYISGDPEAKEKLDLFFHYFNNFPEFYKWLVLGIFGSIYGLKPGMDLLKKK